MVTFYILLISLSLETREGEKHTRSMKSGTRLINGNLDVGNLLRYFGKEIFDLGIFSEFRL